MREDVAKEGTSKHFFCLAPENLISRNDFCRPVPRQPAHSPHPSLIECLTHGLVSFLTLFAAAFIYTVNRHWVNPELIGSHNCITMAFTAESPLAQGQ